MFYFNIAESKIRRKITAPLWYTRKNKLVLDKVPRQVDKILFDFNYVKPFTCLENKKILLLFPKRFRVCNKNLLNFHVAILLPFIICQIANLLSLELSKNFAIHRHPESGLFTCQVLGFLSIHQNFLDSPWLVLVSYVDKLPRYLLNEEIITVTLI